MPTLLRGALGMQCATFGKDGVRMRLHLAEEQARVRKRSDALRCAARALRQKGDQREEFADFREHLSLELFEQTVVEQGIPKRQRYLQSLMYRDSAGELSPLAHRFGVCRRPGVDEWWAHPLLVDRVALDSRGYTGKPGYCAPHLWHLRAWAVALGGFPRLSLALQEELMCLERCADVDSCFIQLEVHGQSAWRHAREVWPGALPRYDVWLEIAAA